MLKIASRQNKLKVALNFDPVASTLDMDKVPTVGNRMGLLSYEQFNTTSAPTQTHRNVLKIIEEEFEPLQTELSGILEKEYQPRIIAKSIGITTLSAFLVEFFKVLF